MNINTKYKFSMKGWFGNSWKHSLAAKGIQTKYAAKKIRIPASAARAKEIEYWEFVRDKGKSDPGIDNKFVKDTLSRLKDPKQHLPDESPLTEKVAKDRVELSGSILRRKKGEK